MEVMQTHRRRRALILRQGDIILDVPTLISYIGISKGNQRHVHLVSTPFP
jgi:hypothetical protein